MQKKLNRRDFLKNALVASTASALTLSFEEQTLLAKPVTTPSNAPGDVGTIPMGKIGEVAISRIFCGGNLTSGFAHSRDLIYVSALLRQYFTEEKIFETWQICEQQGVNTAILRLDDFVIRLINKYWKEHNGKLQWIAQIKVKETDLQSEAQRAVDTGAIGVYVHGGVADQFVANGKVDLLGEALESIRRLGVIAGVAGHSIAVPMACEKAGLNPDFYMKTLNSANYWSAGPRLPHDPRWKSTPGQPVEPEYPPDDHDNIWEVTPRQTVEFMRTVKKPWIAYKVLAAGAIPPKEGFEFAFNSGADFICVGMFDFQVREDVRIAKEVLAGKLQRQRPWLA